MLSVLLLTMMIVSLLDDRLVDEDAAAAVLAVKPQTMAKWRLQGRGPRFVRVGRAIRYRVSELQRFVEAGTAQSTGEADASDRD